MGKVGRGAVKAYNGFATIWNLGLAIIAIVAGVAALIGAIPGVDGGGRLLGLVAIGYGLFVLATGVFGRR